MHQEVSTPGRSRLLPSGRSISGQSRLGSRPVTNPSRRTVKNTHCNADQAAVRWIIPWEWKSAGPCKGCCCNHGPITGSVPPGRLQQQSLMAVPLTPDQQRSLEHYQMFQTGLTARVVSRTPAVGAKLSARVFITIQAPEKKLSKSL